MLTGVFNQIVDISFCRGCGVNGKSHAGYLRPKNEPTWKRWIPIRCVSVRTVTNVREDTLTSASFPVKFTQKTSYAPTRLTVSDRYHRRTFDYWHSVHTKTPIVYTPYWLFLYLLLLLPPRLYTTTLERFNIKMEVLFTTFSHSCFSPTEILSMLIIY